MNVEAESRERRLLLGLPVGVFVYQRGNTRLRYCFTQGCFVFLFALLEVLQSRVLRGPSEASIDMNASWAHPSLTDTHVSCGSKFRLLLNFLLFCYSDEDTNATCQSSCILAASSRSPHTQVRLV
jgi:hypothetical protein